MALLLGFTLGAWATPVVPAAPASGPASTGPSRQVLEALVQQLGHPRFEVRDQARARLCALSPDDLPELVGLYRRESRYELRLRLRYIIEYMYYRRLMAGQLGFIGIGPVELSGVFDPGTGQEVRCVLVSRVLEGYAAHKAGFQAGDLLVALDGQPIGKVLDTVVPPQPAIPGDQVGLPGRQLRASPAMDAFTAEVKRRQPGAKLSFRALRCAPRSRQIRLTVPQDADAALAGARLAPTIIPNQATFEARTVGLSMRGGLHVASLATTSPASRAGLRVNDVIVAVNGQAPDASAGTERLVNALKSAGAGQEATLEAIALQQITLVVTLEARPVDLMNPLDMFAAQMRFAEWWHEQTGERSIRRPQRPINPPDTSNPSAPGLPEPLVLP